MRLLSAVLFACATAGLVYATADKDEDKAKEAAVAFLKAVKAKDLDAVMKTVDVPYLSDDKGSVKLIEKTEDLKEALKPFLEKVQPDKVPSEVGKTLDLPAIRELLAKKDDKKIIESIEKVLGKAGYAVFLVQNGKERGAVLVRIKDGKAAVVGIPR